MRGRVREGEAAMHGQVGIDVDQLATGQRAPTRVVVHGLARDHHAGPIRQCRGADVDAVGAGVEGAPTGRATGASWQQPQLVGGRIAQRPQIRRRRQDEIGGLDGQMSSQAAMGCFATSGVPSGPNTPMPLPSGLRWLCSTRLSGASNSQNVAATGRAPAFRPNNLHTSGSPHPGRLADNQLVVKGPDGGHRTAAKQGTRPKTLGAECPATVRSAISRQVVLDHASHRRPTGSAQGTDTLRPDSRWRTGSTLRPPEMSP